MTRAEVYIAELEERLRREYRERAIYREALTQISLGLVEGDVRDFADKTLERVDLEQQAEADKHETRQ